MNDEQPEQDATPEDPSPRIRRGRGLRLSVDRPPPEEAAVPPPDAGAAGLRRGGGLRLSVAAAPAPAVEHAPPQAQRLRLAHGEIAYRQAGAGPPLLLLHGWGASARYWFRTLNALADMRACYAIDLPGFGASPALTTPTSVPRLAELVIECADALGLERFDLNGHSFGGSVAAYLAGRWPGRVRRLVLTSFGTQRTELERALLEAARRPAVLALDLWQPWLNLWQPWLDLWRPAATALMGIPPIPQLLAAWFMERVPDDQDLVREALADLLRMDLRAHLACFASIGDPELTAALGDIRAPTLLIGGLRDRATPPDAVEAAGSLLPGSRLAWLEGCGHMPMIECPEAYQQAVRDFLEANGD